MKNQYNTDIPFTAAIPFGFLDQYKQLQKAI